MDQLYLSPGKMCEENKYHTIDNGYEGIKYAADHGCKIINCVWGDPENIQQL